MKSQYGLLLIIVYLLGACRGPGEIKNNEAQSPAAVPNKLVALTFDDRSTSWIENVAPLLVQYGFGATFFITEGEEFPFRDQADYWISWQDIRRLHELGFEIASHSYGHLNYRDITATEAKADLERLEKACLARGIPKPVSFAYPGGAHARRGVDALSEQGYLFARRAIGPEYPSSLDHSLGPAYDPGEDHPLLVPSTLVWGSPFPANSRSGRMYGGGLHSETGTTFSDFVDAVGRATDGKITVLTFHGVPDYFEHCSTSFEDFARCMKFLHDEGFSVVALRDLAKYVDWANLPEDPYEPIQKRMARMQAATENGR